MEVFVLYFIPYYSAHIFFFSVHNYNLKNHCNLCRCEVESLARDV